MRQLCPQPSQKHHQPPQKLHQPPQKLHQLTICFQLCHSHQLPKLHHRLQSQHGHKFPSQMEYLKKPFEEVRRWQIMPKILCLASSARKSLLALEKDYRLSLVKDATFKKYCIEDKHKSWSLCRKSIDSAIRKLRFKNI